MAPLGTVQRPDIGIQSKGYRLPKAAHVGRVRLAIADLERSVSFYTKVIGLQVLERSASFASLGPAGSSDVLLDLEQVPGVRPIDRRTRLGLYHSAFLLPTRAALASFVAYLVRNGIDFGSGDHLYSEALYLVDPDGLSVEVYADRSRDRWIYEGRELVSATEPLDFKDLLTGESTTWKGMPAGTVVGHVHLYVGDLQQASRFYHEVLGLDIVTWRYPGALFMSAGGYHHDVAVNVWAAGSPPASATDSRLLFWELVLPDEETRQAAQQSLATAGFACDLTLTGEPSYVDPWGIQVVLVLEKPAIREQELAALGTSVSHG